MAADETIFPYNMGSSGGYPPYPHSFGSVSNVMNDPNSFGTFLVCSQLAIICFFGIIVARVISSCNDST